MSEFGTVTGSFHENEVVMVTDWTWKDIAMVPARDMIPATYMVETGRGDSTRRARHLASEKNIIHVLLIN